jgi:hypothetical protein
MAWRTRGGHPVVARCGSTAAMARSNSAAAWMGQPRRLRSPRRGRLVRTGSRFPAEGSAIPARPNGIAILARVRDVAVPDRSSPLNRSVAACLASILEVEVGSVPLPPVDHPEPWTVWRNWLAQRGLGLVPIADPVNFSWPGPWLAVLPAADSNNPCAAVAFGAPPGLAWSPLPTREFEEVREGFLVAPTDVALVEREVEPSAARGTVAAILISPEAEAEPHAFAQARAEAGRGLVGDRYYDGTGTFSNPNARGVDLTLIEQETIDNLRKVFPGYRAEDARRNVVTSGIALNALVGWRFQIGEVECVGQRLCEPCAHLDRIAVKGALRHLVHRGGLRADIVRTGSIAVGDAVEAVSLSNDYVD